MEKGTLYIVATPIGNLRDITLRALEVLQDADFIAAEDTRRTIKLLNHYEIKNKLVSFHEYSYEAKVKAVLGALEEGKSVALVSDAGTPVISDPGYILVKKCAERGYGVESVPGACAAVSAVALSGIDCREFVFAGFLPSKSAARKKELERLSRAGMPLVVYESPNRVVKTLADILDVLGDVPVCIARELTKLHEEVVRVSAREALEFFDGRGAVKGEIVIVAGVAVKEEAGDAAILSRLKQCLKDGMTKKEAVAFVTAELSSPKNKVYQLLIGLTGK